MHNIFPPELVEEILAYLRHSRNALQTCSLLCKSLSRRSQEILFSSIALKMREASYETRPLVLGQGRAVSNLALKRLVEVVKSSPRLAGYIVNLKVAHDEFGNDDKELYSVGGHLLGELLSHLPNLQSFTLFRQQHNTTPSNLFLYPPANPLESALDWNYLPDTLQSAIISLSSRPSMKQLHLEEIENIPFGTINIDNMEQICVFNINFGVTDIPLFSVPPTLVPVPVHSDVASASLKTNSLRVLRLICHRSFELPQVTNWIFKSYIPCNIRSLTISSIWQKSVAAASDNNFFSVPEVQTQIQRLIAVCVNTLEEVHLYTPRVDVPFHGFIPNDFSQHNKLKNLTKRLVFFTQNAGQHDRLNPLPGLLDTLSSIHPKSQVMVTLYLGVVIHITGDTFDFSQLLQLDNILCNTSSTLRLVVETGTTGRSVLASIEDHFPNLLSQNRIEFQACDHGKDNTWNWRQCEHD